MKYSRFKDNFRQKLGIFDDICVKASIPMKYKALALSFMLKGVALDFYYTNISQTRMLFQNVCKTIKEYFQSPKYEQSIQD